MCICWDHLFCTNCGKDLGEKGYGFCPYCGKIQHICPTSARSADDAPGPDDRTCGCSGFDEVGKERRILSTVLSGKVLVAVAVIIIVLIAVIGMSPGTHTVSVIAEGGISAVSGADSYHTGDIAYLTAQVEEGYSFLGWYSQEGLISSDISCAVRVSSDVEVHAIAETEIMANVSSNTISMVCPIDPGPQTTWTIKDRSTGQVVATLDGAATTYDAAVGTYTVTVETTLFNGDPYERTDDVGIGTKMVGYTWYYNYEMYTLSFSVPLSTCEYWESVNKDGRFPNTDSKRSAFVTSGMKSVKFISDSLYEKSAGMTDAQRADFVLKFVQSTDYVSDEVSRGTVEWFKYPVETLVDKNGDCEDTSILYCALMENMGYDTVLLMYSASQGYDVGHMACAVKIDGRGSSYEVNGERYYYCETTSNTNVGVIPDKYNMAHIIVI
jgi:hypothetical protein